MPPADAGPTQKAGSILSAGLKQKPQAVGCLLESKRQLAADPRLHPSPLLQTRSWLFKARAWRSAAGLAPGRGCGRPDVLKRKFRPAHIATQSGSSTGSQVSARRPRNVSGKPSLPCPAAGPAHFDAATTRRRHMAVLVRLATATRSGPQSTIPFLGPRRCCRTQQERVR